MPSGGLAVGPQELPTGGLWNTFSLQVVRYFVMHSLSFSAKPSLIYVICIGISSKLRRYSLLYYKFKHRNKVRFRKVKVCV